MVAGPARFTNTGRARLSEDRWVAIGEKFAVHRCGCLCEVLRGYHDSEIESRGALRNHQDVHALQGAQDARGDAGRFADFIADGARMARSFSMETSVKGSSSAQISGRRESSSTVSETLTSEVETMSTGVSKRSKASKMRRKKP